MAGDLYTNYASSILFVILSRRGLVSLCFATALLLRHCITTALLNLLLLYYHVAYCYPATILLTATLLLRLLCHCFATVLRFSYY